MVARLKVKSAQTRDVSILVKVSPVTRVKAAHAVPVVVQEIVHSQDVQRVNAVVLPDVKKILVMGSIVAKEAFVVTVNVSSHAPR